MSIYVMLHTESIITTFLVQQRVSIVFLHGGCMYRTVCVDVTQ